MPGPEPELPVDGRLHRALKDDLRFPLAWGTAPERDFAVWRRTARRTVEDHLLVDDQDGTPYDPEFTDGPEGDGYRRQTVVLSLTRHTRVRGSLLTPHGTGPFPAVLLLHDHGGMFDIGREKCVRPWDGGPARLATAEEWAARHFSGRFPGDALARRGYAVLCLDALGWGDRGPVRYERQQALAAHLYRLGSSLAGLMAREDARAAAFLAGLDRVDARRVAALGFSLGGYRAWQTTALSDDVAAAVSLCWMTGLKETLVPGDNALRGQSAYYMLHPGLSRYLDLPDVASIAAPRPMFFLGGARDPLFTPAGVAAAYARLRAVWDSRRAGHRLVTGLWPDAGHEFTAPMQDEVFTWLDTVL